MSEQPQTAAGAAERPDSEQSDSATGAVSVAFGGTVAARYDSYRGLPDAVVATIRERLVAADGLHPGARVLDLGAGTGRIARSFLLSDYQYAGVDASAPMLARLRAFADASGAADLALASVTHLPFAAATFDLVVTVQVLGVVPDWRLAIEECRRILKRGGRVIVGRTEHDPESLHARVRAERNRLLREAGVEIERPGAEEDEILAELQARIGRPETLPPVLWQSEARPRTAIEANLSGWRVQNLSPNIQANLRRQLTETLGRQLGDLDRPRPEAAAFTLHSFQR